MNNHGETCKETVSQGGGSSVSLSAGDEQREPESAISKLSTVDLHGPGKRAEGGAARSAARLRPSLSQSHNSDEIKNSSTPAGQTSASAVLTGSQKKIAFALRQNCEQMVKESGINSVGFLTLTVGDVIGGVFIKVYEFSEASRRFDRLRRRVLSGLLEKAVVVTQRHEDGGIHFHLLGILAGRPDIRTGLDFEALKRRDYRSVPPALKAIWKQLRTILPRYGFGRAELLPVRKTAEAVASYVGRYIETNICNRPAADRGKRLVRYLGWNQTQLKANDFSWATKGAMAWRCKTRELAAMVNILTPEQAAFSLGPRWAFYLTDVWRRACGSDTGPLLTADYRTREIMRGELVQRMGLMEARRLEAASRLQLSDENSQVQELWPWCFKD